MGEDHTFRIILAVGMLVFMPIGIYWRMRSQASGEKLDRRQEGIFVLLTLRPLGAAMMVALIAFVISPELMAWASVPLPAWGRWIGVAIGAISGVLLTWTLSNLGDNLTDTVVTRRKHTMVTTGPYAWVRHPFYSSAALAIVANSLVTSNWFVFATGCLVFALLAIRCRTEEEKLVERFGDEYRAYMQSTARFVPRFRTAARDTT